MKWWKQANCRGSDTALFFSHREDDKALAASYCVGCPVFTECLDDAVSNNERHQTRAGRWME